MVVDGVKKADTRKVVLDEFFDQPAHVVIKILGPYAKAQIREVLMSGFNIGDVDMKGKATTVQTRSEGSADREIKIRDLKLAHGFASTDIRSGGVVPEWNKALWDSLDEADPRILEKVIAAIDDFSKMLEGGDAANPT
ncbi:MAG: hypothetical protein PHO67_08400 [Candidatus Omnitrophica bacterium]|nr:hypothetical protein [Candidatus Omnitrophota bacterium]